jgi:predicted ester cyclase
MSTEDNKELGRRALEAVNTHNVSEYARYFARDSKFYGFAPQTLDLEGYKQTLAMAFAAFPDWHLTIEDMIAEGDKVVTRYTIRGTHQGAFLGIPPRASSSRTQPSPSLKLSTARLSNCGMSLTISVCCNNSA